MVERIEAFAPDLDAYAMSGRKAFDVPGLAIGIVADARLAFARGFGVRSNSGGEPVDTRT
jgi:CubicO group peptidase (beta-lactamase class C family)